MSVDINIQEQKKLIDSLMLEGTVTEKEVRKIIKDVLKDFRNSISKKAQAYMGNDPRQAYRAVRHMVYKSILGGNVSILNGKKASKTRVEVKKERKLDKNPHQRGGNRRPRSARTEQVDSYYGTDRGFILRFLNAGTDNRQTRFGNRGSIAARNWFPQVSQSEFNRASEVIAQKINEYLNKHNK